MAQMMRLEETRCRLPVVGEGFADDWGRTAARSSWHLETGFQGGLA